MLVQLISLEIALTERKTSHNFIFFMKDEISRHYGTSYSKICLLSANVNVGPNRVSSALLQFVKWIK